MDINRVMGCGRGMGREVVGDGIQRNIIAKQMNL